MYPDYWNLLKLFKTFTIPNKFAKGKKHEIFLVKVQGINKQVTILKIS